MNARTKKRADFSAATGQDRQSRSRRVFGLSAAKAIAVPLVFGIALLGASVAVAQGPDCVGTPDNGQCSETITVVGTPPSGGGGGSEDSRPPLLVMEAADRWWTVPSHGGGGGSAVPDPNCGSHDRECILEFVCARDLGCLDAYLRGLYEAERQGEERKAREETERKAREEEERLKREGEASEALDRHMSKILRALREREELKGCPFVPKPTRHCFKIDTTFYEATSEGWCFIEQDLRACRRWKEGREMRDAIYHFFGWTPPEDQDLGDEDPIIIMPDGLQRLDPE